MKRISLFFLLIICLFLLNSCSALRTLQISQDKLPWKSAGDNLLEDNFDDDKSGWEVVNTVYELKGYSEEGYLISINHKGGRSVSTTGLNFRDALIQVEAQKLTGSSDAYLGIVCRYQDNLNYYRFVITPDGYAGIIKVLDGVNSTLPGGSLIYTQAVVPNDGTNLIEASCVGKQLRLSINGKLVVSAEDDQFLQGDVGIFGETGQGGAGSFIFNHFVVVKP